MRIAVLFIIWCYSCAMYCQFSGYYDSVNGLTGDDLKAALHDIVKQHTTFSYTSGSTDVWDILKEADRDSLNSENVILFYTNRSVNAAQEYNNGAGWSREHVWAKSRGDFGTSRGPGTDCHHLRAADVSVNSTRNNRYFAEGGDAVYDEGEFTGCYVDNLAYTFEPRDAIKGDVARMLFYMAIRYEGDNGEVDLELTEAVLPQSDKSPLHGVLSLLLKWHLQDPPDNFERKRNDIIQSYQGNRNPFVDNPDYASLIWGTVTKVKPVHNYYSLYPNPVTDWLTIKSQDPIVSIAIIDLSGKRISKLYVHEKINVQDLSAGTYILEIRGQRTIQYASFVKLP